jgi:hypothetical protein
MELLSPANWIEIVEDYSARHLTRMEDKLPALAGMAHEYMKRQRDTYLAGLWLISLVEHLCWRVMNSSLSSKPIGYRAPSWTWACLDGKVSFHRTKNKKDRNYVQVQHVATVPTGMNVMGEVQDGTLTLYGKVCHQLWRRRPETESARTSYAAGWYYERPFDARINEISTDEYGTPQYSIARLILDVTDSGTEVWEIWSLPLMQGFALALRQSDTKIGCFERIGAIIWRSDKDDHFSSEARSITII